MVEVVHDVNSVYSERSQEQLWLLDKSAWGDDSLWPR